MVISGHLLILEHLVTDRQACRGHWHSKVWNLCRFIPRLYIMALWSPLILIYLQDSSIFYNLNPFTHYLQKVGAWFCVQMNDMHYSTDSIHYIYFLRINMDPQVFHHIVFNTNDSQRTLSKCWNALYSGNKSTRFMIFIDVWICLSVYTGKSNKGQLTPGMSGTWPWSDLPGFLASQMYVCIPQSSASKLVSALGPLREGNCWFWSVR